MDGGGDAGSAAAGGYFETHSYVTPIYTTFSLDTALSFPPLPLYTISPQTHHVNTCVPIVLELVGVPRV